MGKEENLAFELGKAGTRVLKCSPRSQVAKGRLKEKTDSLKGVVQT